MSATERHRHPKPVRAGAVLRRLIAAGLAGVVLVACETVPEAPPPAPPGSGVGPPGSTPPVTPPVARVLPPPAPRSGPVRAPEVGEETSEHVTLGTGELIRLSPPEGRRPAAGGEITLNFQETDLREAVRVILGDMLGRNYTMDPKVQGVVTVHTSRPLAREDLLPVLESLLQMNNAALVQTSEGFRVVPLANAAREALPTTAGTAPSPGREGYSVQLVPLRYVSAVEVQKLLEPFVPQGATLTADPQRNMLVVAGPGRSIRDFLETVQVFDVDWLKGMSMGIFPVVHTDAGTIATELEEVIGAKQGSPLAGLLKLIPIERINSVLVVTPQRRYLEEARLWLERLDRGGEGPGRRLFVYHVKNGKADHLAQVLNEVFVNADEGGAARPAAGFQPVMAPAVQAAIQPPVQPVVATPSPSEGVTGQQLSAPPAPPPAVAVAAGGGPAGPGALEAAPVSAVGAIKIIPDTVNNTLLVMATPAEYQIIEAAIGRLDIIPRQVLVEATIAEIGLRDDLQYGVQWFIKGGIGRFGWQVRSTTGTSSDLPVSTAPGLSAAVFKTIQDVRIFVDALSNISHVKVLSSPQLLVIDNQTANIRVGEQVPVITRQSASTQTGDAIVNEVQFRDTGVLLTVTPRINAGGLVTLEVSQEVSTPGDVVGSTGNVSIDQRTIESSIAVQSGETVVLGGLIQETQTKGRTGVPILNKLPFVGPLFGSTVDNSNRTELLVLLTPRVVNNTQEARDVTKELRERLKGVTAFELEGKTGGRTRYSPL